MFNIMKSATIVACVVVGFCLELLGGTYYVDAERGNDGWDGTSAEVGTGGVGPKKSLSEANALMTAQGDILNIAPGTYTLTNAITAAAKDLTYRGTDPNGNPSNVVINGDGKYCGFVSTIRSTAYRFECLTISNCCNNASVYGSALYANGGGLVTNCLFVANTNAFANGTGGAVYVYESGTRTFANVRFERNAATGSGAYGGGIYNKTTTTSDLYMRGCTFSHNYATKEGGGGWSNRDARDIALYDCTFMTNSSATAGAWGKAWYVISNCVFRGNVAFAGNGGVNDPGDYQGKKDYRDCKFFGNRASKGSSTAAIAGAGGALSCPKAGMQLTHCLFSDNVADKSGSAVWQSAAAGSWVRDCTFDGNTGGAALSGTFNEISDCKFFDNQGGAYSCYDSAVLSAAHLVTNCIFRRNSKINYRRTNQEFVRGAALQLGDYTALGPSSGFCMTVVDCEFTENACTNALNAGTCNGINAGGAVFAPFGVNMERCAFTNNLCEGDGGAFCGLCSKGIRDCTFVGNSGNLGSVMSFETDAVADIKVGVENVISNCVFKYNWSAAANSPSAIFIGQGNLHTVDCSFLCNSNVTTSSGDAMETGAIGYNPNFGAIVGSQQHKARYHPDYRMRLSCDRCTFDGNYCNGCGGAISFYVNTLTNSWSSGACRNCLFKDNTAVPCSAAWSNKGLGGAIAVGGANGGNAMTIENCTFTGNTAGNNAKGGAGGGGIKVTGARTGVTNCVFYANTDKVSGTATDDIAMTDPTMVDYTFAPTSAPIPTDAHNILSDENPFCSDKYGSFRVKEKLGRDAGLLQSWMTPTALDLDRHARLRGSAVDFGCYEYYSRRGIVLFFH